MRPDNRRAQGQPHRPEGRIVWRGGDRRFLPIGLNQGPTREEFPGHAARRLVFVRLDRGGMLRDEAGAGAPWDRRSST